MNSVAHRVWKPICCADRQLANTTLVASWAMVSNADRSKAT